LYVHYNDDTMLYIETTEQAKQENRMA